MVRSGGALILSRTCPQRHPPSQGKSRSLTALSKLVSEETVLRLRGLACQAPGVLMSAENGVTAHPLISIFGWETLRQVEKYTGKARAKRLARDAMHLIVTQNEGRSLEQICGVWLPGPDFNQRPSG